MVLQQRQQCRAPALDMELEGAKWKAQQLRAIGVRHAGG